MQRFVFLVIHTLFDATRAALVPRDRPALSGQEHQAELTDLHLIVIG